MFFVYLIGNSSMCQATVDIDQMLSFTFNKINIIIPVLAVAVMISQSTISRL